ncbi:MAG: glycoside hydrolase family 52 protein [Armatimonadota bacterium]
MNNPFFNAHHAPIGAFATFTLGFPGAKGGLGLELGAPADQDIYIGLETPDGSMFEALPFYAAAATADAEQDERRRFEGEQAALVASGPQTARVVPFAADRILREFRVATDTWIAGDLRFTVYSPVRGVPDPDHSDEAELLAALAPAVLAEVTIDNTQGTQERRAFFGYRGSDPYAGMRRLDDTASPLVGVGQGRGTAIVTDSDGVRSGLAFSLNSLLEVTDPDNLAFGLGGCGALLLSVPPGETRTFRFALCFYRDGRATAGMDTTYYYTRLFPDIESVASYTLSNFDRLRHAAVEANALVEDTKLSDDQKFQLAHAIRAYYGSTQFLLHDDKPLWIVNEGEYRMMNTFDLTVDQLFFELKMNPWTVRNELDLYSGRYRYEDAVRFPGDATEHPGGISFTHDVGSNNVFSRPRYSSYEQSGLHGTFSYMTHEQLVNWLCCATVYATQTGDDAWVTANFPLVEACFQSLLNRDHPDPAQRDGIMSLDSTRCGGGAEITTYDSLDVSLGQARNNLYLAGKTWACYVALEKLFTVRGKIDLAQEAGAQADRCATTLVRHVTPGGYIPAVLGEGNDSRIIPAIEGLIFPLFTDCREALDPGGRFADYLRALKTHFEAVLVPGVCLFDDGGWKISSTSDNSWLSKIYLCQFVARHILGIDSEAVTTRADAAHVAWLTDPDNGYWSWSDQMVRGKAIGSRYYPRGVTAYLWRDE